MRIEVMKEAIWDGGVAGSMLEGDDDAEAECEYVEIEVRDEEEQH
jgi:hypothetical protein